MTKPKHTPGPWAADCMNNVWGQATGRHGKIANLADRPQDDRYDVIPKNEVEANAHLIAAAPDMYEAAILARAVLGRMVPNSAMPPPPTQSEISAAHIALWDAIDKARGEKE